MDKRLIEAAHKGDVYELHNMIKDDPMTFRFVELATGETPLNIACIGGHVNFVKDVLNLSPKSSTTELNQDGLSPLHIAAFNGDIEIVKELLNIGPHLCLVQGKEERLPLHTAVVKGRVEVIRELLSSCLDSITQVTARGESCFHLVVKNNRFEAFKLLVDHVILHKRKEILNKKDEQGNSVFHLAAYGKHYQVIKLLLDMKYDLTGIMEINSLNKRGLTPLDVLTSQGGDSEIEEMLRLARALRVEELNSFPHQSGSQNLVTTNPSDRRTREEQRKNCSKWFKSLHNLFKYNMIADTPIKLRDTLLVIAILITTTTYQAILSPPGGVWQEDYLPNTSNTTVVGSSTKKHTAGTSVMATQNPISYGLFLLYNSIGFYMALHMLNFLIFGLPMQFELRVALLALTSTYVTSMIGITPEGGVLLVLFIVISTTMPVMMPILTKVVRDFKKLRWCTKSHTVSLHENV